MSRPTIAKLAIRWALVVLVATTLDSRCGAQSDGGNSETAVAPIVPLVTPQPPPSPPVPPPYGGPLLERMKLTGDWGGSRSDLRDCGVTFDASSTQYYQGDVAGGLSRAFEYGGRADYFLNVNGEKLGLPKGFFIDLHAETRYGESANGLPGTFLPTNLMLAFPQPTGSVTALTGVKFTQFLSENTMVFAGKINVFDGFKQQLTGAAGIDGFMNTSLMFNPVYIRTVPYSTLGAGFAYLKNYEPVVSALILDTNNTPTVSGFETFFNNGATFLWQVNVPTQFWELPGHQGLSGSYSSGSYNNIQGSPYLNPISGTVTVPTGVDTGSWSFAYNYDQAFYVSPDNPQRVWGVFGNLGVADGQPSPIRWFSSVGLAGASPLTTRKLDTFGIGYSYLGLSDRLKGGAFVPVQNEQAIELFYNIGVTRWFHVTPDIQILDPFLQRTSTALLVGMRAKIDF
ncbi:MAG TPA: carbohydrate porin [Schlesneria sp.]